MKKTRSMNSYSDSVADSQAKSKGPGSDPRLLVNIFASKKRSKFLIESVSTDVLADDAGSDCVEVTIKTTRGDFSLWLTTKHDRKEGAVLLQPGPMVIVDDF